MDSTLLLSQIIGPVLVLRGLSILIDRDHFKAMIAGLENEATTVAFSLVPIALLMGCIALALTQRDTSSLAGVLILIIAWGGILKASALILFPRLVLAKARWLGEAGFLNVVVVACFVVGGYFVWFGYLSAWLARS